VTYSFLGPDPVEAQVEDVLARLASGEPSSQIERRQVDVKEEPGRRGHGGRLIPGSAHSDVAARYLAAEMSCMANTGNTRLYSRHEDRDLRS
jgi:ATP-dependent DNA helicase RecG